MTTVALAKLLDLKQWQPVTSCPTVNAANMFVIRSDDPVNQASMFVCSATVVYLYHPKEDAFISLPSPALGSFAAGCCGTWHPNGPSGTATAGSASTITTNLTIPGSLAGYTIRITGGTGAGQEKVITSNTFGANSVITISGTWATNPDATSTYTILSGRYFVFGGGTLAAGSFRYWDLATQAWTTVAYTGLAASIGTDAKMECTPSTNVLASGTATSATSTTLVNSAKTWTVNQWTNAQVRIVAGTGAGQVRTIASNTATALTVAAWTVTPDATSQYQIAGNDDFIYLIGNNAVTLYRYSISGNTWSTITPSVARSSAPGAGASLQWIDASPDSVWTNESAIKNGKYLYSFRGGAGNILDIYDIAANSWAQTAYAGQSETFTSGTGYGDRKGMIWISKEATGRFFAFEVAKNELRPLSTLNYPQGAAVLGDKFFTHIYTDGATDIVFVYQWLNSLAHMFRMMVI